MKKEPDDLGPEPVVCTQCGHGFVTRSIRPTCSRCKSTRHMEWLNAPKRKVDSSPGSGTVLPV